MVWIYGGGFQGGSASEPRQDGDRASRRRASSSSASTIASASSGFLAHPELTKESPDNASGNYGILDQIAALQWVQKNIAAFGGDPGNVTIFGESAGSFSVSILMASPLAKGLFHKAIGESGASFPSGPQPPLGGATLASAEAEGEKFAAAMNAPTIEALRARPATELLGGPGTPPRWFSPIVDGYAVPAPVSEIFAKGQQHKVPLLAGWNAGEVRSSVTLRPQKPTAESFKAELAKRFGASADAIGKAYGGSDRRRGARSRRRAGERQLHQLRHVEVARGAPRHQRRQGLSLPVRSRHPDRAGPHAERHARHRQGCRCASRRRDRVRLRHARHDQERDLVARGSRALERDDGVLEQLREDGRAEGRPASPPGRRSTRPAAR